MLLSGAAVPGGSAGAHGETHEAAHRDPQTEDRHARVTVPPAETAAAPR